ncbi:helix-turn-helix domain-containing protein [Comamonas terrigena]|uniref:helix-turn-helix domain-containing protein n=1 Tax=Comamonas terrigena TaxID=32013 RepID=UPI0028AA12A8|nr:helix-turn-helix domain-containing protein [Comamonas terrigena]
MNAISLAIQGAGGPAKVARQCGVSVQAVCFWRDGKRTLPAEHGITLEKMNEGRIRCEQMLPDVDWAYIRSTKPAPLPEVSHG